MSVQKPPTPPKLVAENAIERGETESITFTAAKWNGFEQHFKRRLASAANSDEINGRSDRQEMESWLEGKKRVNV